MPDWLQGHYQYAHMQLYLARVQRAGIETPEDQFDDNTEMVKFVDGHRGVGMPLIHIKRNKIVAGEYLLFYRAAFKFSPDEILATNPSPYSHVSAKRPPTHATDLMDGYHQHRKLVLTVHFPANSKLQMQRIETEPHYGKQIFLQMRRHYKHKFETPAADE